MAKRYKSPTGSPIVGTSESVLVMYTIEGIHDDGTPDYGTAADSTVYWDTAEQQTDKKGRLLYQDEDGSDWAFEDLVEDKDEEDEEDDDDAE